MDRGEHRPRRLRGGALHPVVAAVSPPRHAEGVQFFVPCPIENHANRREHWRQERGYQKRLRDATYMLAFKAHILSHGRTQEIWGEAPKTVSLEAHVWNIFDEHDGLRNACKPLVDGLVRAGLIHDDAPSSGHQFLYTQVIDRKERGVLITIEPLADGRERGL